MTSSRKRLKQFFGKKVKKPDKAVKGLFNNDYLHLQNMVVHYKQFQSFDSITDMSRIASKRMHAILDKHCKVSPHILTELQFPL